MVQVGRLFAHAPREPDSKLAFRLFQHEIAKPQNSSCAGCGHHPSPSRSEVTVSNEMSEGCRDDPHIIVLTIDELNQVASCVAFQDVCPLT